MNPRRNDYCIQNVSYFHHKKGIQFRYLQNEKTEQVNKKGDQNNEYKEAAAGNLLPFAKKR